MNANLFKLAKAILKFGSMETNNGVLNYEGELAEGLEVFIENEAGELIPAADGDYETNDQIITVDDGKVASIAEKKPAEPAEPAEPVAPAEPEPTNLAEPEPTEPAAPTEPEPDEKDARIAELEGAIAEKDARIAELEAKLNEPADQNVFSKAHAQEERIKKNPALKYFQ